MAKTKYGHLVKLLNLQPGPVGNWIWPSSWVFLGGVDLEGLDMSFAWASSSRVGEWMLGRGSGHSHPYGECLVFTGIDYDNPNQLGAEIEIAMGEKGERYVFDTPTVVVVPPGVPHGPTITKRVDKACGFLEICLSGEHKSTDLPGRSGTPPTGNKYGHLVKKLDMRDTQRKEGGNADFIAGWSGREMEGFDLNFTWAFHTGLGAWHTRDPHTHPADECLLFVGLDYNNPDYLGAEIEIAMGKEQEKHVFDTPTAVVVPKGLVHCPLITRRVDKPYGFCAISLDAGHETTWLG